MNTWLRTGMVVLGLMIGISAVSAAPDPLYDNFNSDAFWNEMAEGD